MPRHIAFVHTSPVHVASFERLVRSAEPALTVTHLVDEALLADARRLGADDAALVARVHAAMHAAASGGAAIVACTCSTIGGAAERTPTQGRFAAARIDRAMADRAVAQGPQVLVVAALESTLAPTAALLQESAAALGMPIDARLVCVPEAWSHFVAGEAEAYAAAIERAVRAAAAGAGVVVLAQASMAPAAARLADLGIEVLSSPALGVQSLLAQLGGMPG